MSTISGKCLYWMSSKNTRMSCYACPPDRLKNQYKARRPCPHTPKSPKYSVVKRRLRPLEAKSATIGMVIPRGTDQDCLNLLQAVFMRYEWMVPLWLLCVLPTAKRYVHYQFTHLRRLSVVWCLTSHSFGYRGCCIYTTHLPALIMQALEVD